MHNAISPVAFLLVNIAVEVKFYQPLNWNNKVLKIVWKFEIVAHRSRWKELKARSGRQSEHDHHRDEGEDEGEGEREAGGVWADKVSNNWYKWVIKVIQGCRQIGCKVIKGIYKQRCDFIFRATYLKRRLLVTLLSFYGVAWNGWFYRKIPRETFELRSGEHKTFMESTKSMVLLGTSKWFAKIIVKGWNLNGVTLCRIEAEYLCCQCCCRPIVCRSLEINICHCCPMLAPGRWLMLSSGNSKPGES